MLSSSTPHPPQPGTPRSSSEADELPSLLPAAPGDGTAGMAPFAQAASSSIFRRLARTLGVDRAVAFTVLARAWSSLAGIGTILFIARFLTPAEQGFYYTFYSLVALQIVFELGFSVVILQTASHEAAHLEIAPDGTIAGPAQAHGRLADVLQKSVRWYTVGAVLMAATLIPVGLAFFRHAGRGTGAAPAVHYVLPWLLVVLASSGTFQIDPLFSFLEGCGYVPEVARTRLRQSVCGTVLGWSAFLLHGGLFAPGCFILGQALAGMWFLASKRRLIAPLLRHKCGPFRIDWRVEVWPFQWRIAISWLAGYITSQLFNPILMNARGPVEAGQMGMTLSVCGTLTSMAVAWDEHQGRTLRPPDRPQRIPRPRPVLFSRPLAVGSRRGGRLQLRLDWCVSAGKMGEFAPTAPCWRIACSPRCPWPCCSSAPWGNIVVFAEALYLRAHKQEKFMINSIAGAVYIAPVAWFLSRWHNPHGGAWGIAAAYAVGTLFIGLGYGTYTFLRWRRIWHAA